MRLTATSLLLAWSCGPVSVLAQAPAPAAAETLKKSCDKGNAVDCLTLAASHQTGEGAPRDLATAAGFYKKACDGGQARGCLELATMHVSGQGASRDVPR